MTGNETRLGPDDLVGREFAIGLRGYDRDEVDSFLAQAAEAWRASMSAAPSAGLSSSAMAAIADTEPAAPAPAPVDPFAAPAAVDPFAAPASADPFAAPAPAVSADPFAAPAQPAPAPQPDVFDPNAFERSFEPAGFAEAPAPAPAPVPEAAPAAPSPTQAEAERDRTAAYAERMAAELDRAAARTELAQAQEEALRVIDQAQRRAEIVLTGARDKARAEAETVLEDARSRLTPLLEQERAVRARLARLRSELDTMASLGADAPAPTLPEASRLVEATETDPGTPDAPFPVGYGSVTVDR